MRPSCARVLRKLLDERSGSVAIIAAVAVAAMVSSAALTVDVGTFFLTKRKQQEATDIAAIVAAGHLGNAAQAVQSALASNGLSGTPQVVIDLGTYVPNAQLAAGSRFQTAGASSANAVRVGVTGVAPLYFGSAMASAGLLPASLRNGFPVWTQATASQADFAGFAIGSRVASLNGGVANALLGSLLGTSLSLSLADYNALAAAQIDAFAFSRQLATRAGLSGVTYGQLASSSYRIGDVLGAMLDTMQAAGASSAATAPFRQIVQAKAGSTESVALAPLVNYGPFAPSQIGVSGPGAFPLSALDLLMALAEIDGGGRLITVDLTSAVPGLLSLQLTLVVGSRPSGTSFATYGRVGAQVRTAQIRLLLAARLQALPPLLSLALPIYIDTGSATATLASLACDPGPTTPSAVLDVLPSLADAWIGNVSSSDMADLADPASVAYAPIASVLGLAAINGRAHASLASPSVSHVPFSAADIAADVKHSSSTTDPTASLASSLVANLQLTVGPIAGISPPSAVTQVVTQSLSAAAPTLDPVINGLLALLGVRIGEADSWMTGVRCGGGVLVN